MNEKTTPIPNTHARNLLRHFTRRAGSRLRDPNSVEALLAAANARSTQGAPGPLAQAQGHIATMIRMVRAYIEGRYPRIPWRALAAIIGGLVYFVTPLDAIPDFLAMFGLADDVAVLLFVAGQIREEMDRFLLWEASQTSDQNASNVFKPTSET